MASILMFLDHQIKPPDEIEFFLTWRREDEKRMSVISLKEAIKTEEETQN